MTLWTLWARSLRKSFTRPQANMICIISTGYKLWQNIFVKNIGSRVTFAHVKRGNVFTRLNAIFQQVIWPIFQESVRCLRAVPYLKGLTPNPDKPESGWTSNIECPTSNLEWETATNHERALHNTQIVIASEAKQSHNVLIIHNIAAALCASQWP